jgi:hypothetical protein
MVEDNIIPFPNFSKKDRIEQSDDEQLSPQLIEQWSKGLNSSDFKEQWKNFEQMFGFIDSQVQMVIEQFLSSEQGDLVLKTKFLQKLKQICPGNQKYVIRKRDQWTTLLLKDVPIEIEEWPEEWMTPYHLIEEKAYDDPILAEMAQELWIYFIVKKYPFFTKINETLSWTAALHYYTLKVMDEEFANSQVDKITLSYEISSDELLEKVQHFERELWQL